MEVGSSHVYNVGESSTLLAMAGAKEGKRLLVVPSQTCLCKSEENFPSPLQRDTSIGQDFLGPGFSQPKLPLSQKMVIIQKELHTSACQ